MKSLIAILVAVGLCVPIAAFSLEIDRAPAQLDPHAEIDTLDSWNWQGSLRLTSNYLRRGLSLTDEEPTAELSAIASNKKGLRVKTHFTRLEEDNEFRFSFEQDEVFHNLLPGSDLGERTGFYGYFGIQGYAYNDETLQTNRLEAYSEIRYEQNGVDIGLEFARDNEGGQLIKADVFRQFTTHTRIETFLGNHTPYQDEDLTYLYYGIGGEYQLGNWSLGAELVDQDHDHYDSQLQIDLEYRF